MPSVNLLGRVANTEEGTIYMDMGKTPRLVRAEIGSTSFILDLNNHAKCRIVGEGGQGIVYGLALDNSWVIKIMDPLECHAQLVNVQSILQTHRELYTALGEVASVPLWLVYDATNLQRQVVGYGMRSLEGWSHLCDIMSPFGARELGVGFKEVAEIFAALHRALTLIHSLGFIVGDLNASNIMFKNISGRYEVRVIDVDTWSINRPDLRYAYYSNVVDLAEACPQYLAAAEAGQPLPHPEKDYDWWAFGLHLYRSLAKHDPFSEGDFRDCPRTTRIITGITAAHPDVAVRDASMSAALSMGIVLLEALDRHLKAKNTGPFPLHLIAELNRGATVCAKCKKETYREPHTPTPSCHICDARL